MIIEPRLSLSAELLSVIQFFFWLNLNRQDLLIGVCNAVWFLGIARFITSVILDFDLLECDFRYK